jgi:membrane protein
MVSYIKNTIFRGIFESFKFNNLVEYWLLFSGLCALLISVVVFGYVKIGEKWLINHYLVDQLTPFWVLAIVCGLGFGMKAHLLPFRILVLANLWIESVFILSCFIVYDFLPSGAPAFYVGGDVTGLFSSAETYFLFVLAWFGLIVNMALIGDEYTVEWGRKFVGGLLIVIGILLPGFIESYGLLWACKSNHKCYQARASIIDYEISFRELTISCAAALGITFLAGFTISRFVSWAQNYFSYGDTVAKNASSSDLPAASGDKDLPAETTSESMSPANVQELVASPEKRPAAGKTSSSQCLTAAAVLSVVAVVGASFGRWTVRRRR